MPITLLDRRNIAIMAQRKLDERKRLLEMASDAEDSLLAFIRMMWTAVEPGKQLVEGWVLEAVCEHLESVAHGHIKRLIINQPPGTMKLCADSTPVSTPIGVRRHGELAVGDQVFGPDGYPVNIVATSPKGMADHEVVFANGEIIKCNGDHLWRVFDRRAMIWKTLDTATLMALPPERGRSRFFIPDTWCLQFPEAADLLLHPYFLGCWLGDGTSSKPCITHDPSDFAHIEKLARLGYRANRTHQMRGSAVASYFAHQQIVDHLRALNLYNNKHIPERYMRASEDQRMELLAGIIDTDGGVEQDRGRVNISTCSPVLAEQIERLVLSLGFRCYVSIFDAPGYGEYRSDKVAFRIWFNPDRPIPTAIPRKQVHRFDFARRKRAIVAIRKAADPEPGHCITVDRPDGLYLVGRTNVVTHNSLAASVMMPAWLWGPLKRPQERIIAAAYSAYLTERDNGRFRRVIAHPVYRKAWGDVFGPGAKWGDQKVENDKTGWKLATSVGGVLTGERGSMVLIDDPNNPKDVESDSVRDATNLWLREVMPDRLNSLDDDAIVLIQQRTHDKDATGTLAEFWPDFTWLSIPWDYDPLRHCVTVLGLDEDGDEVVWQDPRGVDENGEMLEGVAVNEKGKPYLIPGSPMAKAEGLPAWPERFSDKAIAEQRSIKGPAFPGQYNQTPHQRGGNILRRDWWLTWEADEFPAFGTRIGALDTATEQTQEADYNAMTCWGAFPGEQGNPQVMLTSAWQDRMTLAQLVGRVYRTAIDEKLDYLVIEHKNRGRDVYDELIRQYAGAPFEVQLVLPTKDKISRANAVSVMWSGDVSYRRVGDRVVESWSGGMVWAPNRDWADLVIDQCAAFPRTPHDDLVDSATLAMFWIRRNGVVLRKVEYDEIETEKRRYRKGMSVPYAIR